MAHDPTNWAVKSLTNQRIHPETVPSRTPLPVIVFVTGGAWLIGTAEFYPGMKLALDGEVIVVTINYRLSCFLGRVAN